MVSCHLFDLVRFQQKLEYGYIILIFARQGGDIIIGVCVDVESEGGEAKACDSFIRG